MKQFSHGPLLVVVSQELVAVTGVNGGTVAALAPNSPTQTGAV